MKTLFAALTFSALALLARADFDLGTHGVLHLTEPTGWKIESRETPGQGYGIAIAAPDSTDKALISVHYLPAPKPIDRAKIDAQLTAFSQRFVDLSVEKKVVLKPYKLRQGYGVYTLFTDASLVGKPAKANDYKVAVSGMIQLNESTQILVTQATDDPSGANFAALQKVVEALRISPPAKP